MSYNARLAIFTPEITHHVKFYPTFDNFTLIINMMYVLYLKLPIHGRVSGNTMNGLSMKLAISFI